MNFFRRLKNIWILSAYQVDNEQLKYFGSIKLKKDFPTIEKKQASIINVEEPEEFFKKYPDGEVT
jgi:ribosomal protein L15E